MTIKTKYILAVIVALAALVFMVAGYDLIGGSIAGVVGLLAFWRRKPPVIETSNPTVEDVQHTPGDLPEGEVSTSEALERLRKARDTALALCLTILLPLSAHASMICIDQPTADALERSAIIAEEVTTVPISVEIVSRPQFEIDILDVRSITPLELSVGWPHAGTSQITIDMGVDFEIERPDPTWWEAHDGTIGIVFGGVTVGVGIFALAALFGGL
jgi:hypothetical protein